MTPTIQLRPRGIPENGQDYRTLWLALITIFLIAFAQTRLPPDVPAALLYIVPVFAAATAAGVRGGIGAAILAALLRLGMDLTGGVAFSHPLVPWFGFVIAATVYGLSAWAAGSLAQTAAAEREHALTDPLTGLPNRRYFQEFAQIELNRTQRYGRPLSLASIDVDRFKQVNDTRGHDAGDALLRLIAVEATQALRNSDIVARIGGDEFAVLLPETPTDGAAIALDKLRSRLLEAVKAAGYDVGFSIGVIGYGGGATTLESLLRDADEAMYEAKRGARGTITVRELATTEIAK